MGSIVENHSLVDIRKIKPEEKELLIIFREPMVSITGVAEAKVNNQSGYVLVYQRNDSNKNNHLVINKDLYLILHKVFHQISCIEYQGDYDDQMPI